MRNILFCVKVSLYFNSEYRTINFGSVYEACKFFSTMKIDPDSSIKEVVAVYCDRVEEEVDKKMFNELVKNFYLYPDSIK